MVLGQVAVAAQVAVDLGPTELETEAVWDGVEMVWVVEEVVAAVERWDAALGAALDEPFAEARRDFAMDCWVSKTPVV